jgi:hypothetical protein
MDGDTFEDKTMIFAFFARLLKGRKAFVWQPSIQIRDGQAAAALGIYGPR